jgi:hypothetical protein
MSISDVLSDALIKVEEYEHEDPTGHYGLRLPIQIVKDAMIRLIAYLDDPAANTPQEWWNYKHYDEGRHDYEAEQPKQHCRTVRKPRFKSEDITLIVQPIAAQTEEKKQE